MTAINQDQLIKKATRWSIFGGILTIIAGVLAISLPLATGLGLTLWLGVIFSFVGIAQVVFAFKSEVEDRLAFILELLVGFFLPGRRHHSAA